MIWEMEAVNGVYIKMLRRNFRNGRMCPFVSDGLL